MPRKTELDYLEEIASKTGSATITGTVTVDGSTVQLNAASLAALENIQVTFPSTQNVSVQNASLPVTGTFYQATQPVSATALPLPSGASSETTLSAVNTKIPSNLTVSSTRLLVDGSGVTQPVSIASAPVTPVTDNGGSLTVDGSVSVSNFPATQPVSLATAPTTPVTGTFWQATQPVSLATAPTTPVTGTFWQATQPVSLATAPTTPVTDNGGSLTVDGTVELGATSLAALENISVTFPATQNVNVTNAGLSVSVSNLPATQPISGTVTSLAGGETPTSGTATLTNDTRWELNTEGFGHIAVEIVSTGASWGSNGVVAQAYNGTAPSNADIFAPAGIRYRHSTDGATLNQALNNFYYNLNIAPNVGNAYGTSFIRIDGNTATTLGLPSTGTRYFLFDLTTDKFALRPNFTAGTAQVKYRLYKGKHPFFSARNIIATGEGTEGAVKVQGTVGLNGASVYIDGGYLDSSVNVGIVSSLPSLATGSNTIGSVNVLGGNATAVKVDGSAVTQPVSLASVPSHSVTGPLTNTELRATAVPVSGTVTANTGLTQPLTDTQLRASSVPVSLASVPTHAVTGSGSFTAAQATASNLKAQAQLLNSAGTVIEYATTGSAGTPATDVVSVQGIAGATAIPVSGTVTANTGLTQPLTDTQLRATSVPVSGTVNTYPLQGTTVTNSNFTSTTSATLASAVAGREVLTVFNEGPSTLFINAGTSASTTSYQVRLLAGDYWEAPAGQQSMIHSGIFSSSGSAARVTEVS